MGKLMDVLKQFWVADPVEKMPEKEIDEKMSKEMEKSNKRIEKLEREMNFEHIKVATKSPKIKKTTIKTETKKENAKDDIELNPEQQNTKEKDDELIR